jgi:membrane protein implicated in regulation of membrane protease activity
MGSWYWWALGVVLIIVEVFAPGFVFLWIGASALLTGGIVWLWPGVAWQLQWLAFALIAVASVLAWFAWSRHRGAGTRGHAILNRRAAQQVGAVGQLTEALQNGHGRIRLGDTTWPVTGVDLPAGTPVRVVGADGGRLKVKPVQPHP